MTAYVIKPCRCGECGRCRRFGRGWTLAPAAQEQYDRLLLVEMCTVARPRSSRHRLVLVATRRWRDLFRRRTWWECPFCDLHEEQVQQ